MADGPGSGPRAWLPNLLGWFSFIGLFVTGIVGLVGGLPGKEPTWVGAAYLLLGGLAFWAVLLLVLRRGP